MKIFKMIRGFFLKRSINYKIMQNVIFHVKLLSPTLNRVKASLPKVAGISFEREALLFHWKLTSIVILRSVHKIRLLSYDSFVILLNFKR